MKMQNEILNRVGTKWKDFRKGTNESHVIHYSQETAPRIWSRMNPGGRIWSAWEQKRRWVTDTIVSSPDPSQSEEIDPSLQWLPCSLCRIQLKFHRGTAEHLLSHKVCSWIWIIKSATHGDNSTDWEVCSVSLPSLQKILIHFWWRRCFGVT